MILLHYAILIFEKNYQMKKINLLDYFINFSSFLCYILNLKKVQNRTYQLKFFFGNKSIYFNIKWLLLNEYEHRRQIL